MSDQFRLDRQALPGPKALLIDSDWVNLKLKPDTIEVCLFRGFYFKLKIDCFSCSPTSCPTAAVASL